MSQGAIVQGRGTSTKSGGAGRIAARHIKSRAFLPQDRRVPWWFNIDPQRVHALCAGCGGIEGGRKARVPMRARYYLARVIDRRSGAARVRAAASNGRNSIQGALLGARMVLVQLKEDTQRRDERNAHRPAGRDERTAVQRGCHLSSCAALSGSCSVLLTDRARTVPDEEKKRSRCCGACRTAAENDSLMERTRRPPCRG